MEMKKSVWTKIGEWFIDTGQRTAEAQRPLYEHYLLVAKQATSLQECIEIRHEQVGQRWAEVCVRAKDK